MTIVVEGTFTIECVAALREQLQRAIEEERGGAPIALDLGGVTEFDGAGLQLLLAASRAAAASGRRIALCHPPQAVTAVLAQLALERQFDLERPT